VGLIISGLSAGLVFLAAMPGRASMLRTVDYAYIYAGYKFSVSEVTRQFVVASGPVYLAASAAGFWLYIRKADETARLRALNLAAMSVVGTLVWLLSVRYDLYFDKTLVFGCFICVGASLLLVRLRDGYGRIPAVLAAVLLVLNLAVAVGGLGELGGRDWMRAAFAVPKQPLCRHDIGRLGELVERLRGLTADHDGGVLIAASSMVLDADTVRRAEYRFYGREVARLNIDLTNFLDRPEGCPVRALDADVLVTALPVQIHLAPDEQMSLEFLLNEIEGGGSPLARDYTLVDGPTDLIPGPKFHMKLKTYRRVRPTTVPAALDFIERCCRFMKHPAQNEVLWYRSSLSGRVDAASDGTSGEGWRLTLTPARDGSPVSAALLKPLPPGGSIVLSAAYSPMAGSIRSTLLDYSSCRAGIVNELKAVKAGQGVLKLSNNTGRACIPVVEFAGLAAGRQAVFNAAIR